MSYNNVGTTLFRFVSIHSLDRQTAEDGEKGLGNSFSLDLDKPSLQTVCYRASRRSL